MRMGRTFPREELEAMIEYLATKYPAAFFTQPSMKIPLKQNIVWKKTTCSTVSGATP